MSAADSIDVGQYWVNKENNWTKFVVTGLSGDGWVRYTYVKDEVNGVDVSTTGVQYARSVDDFLTKYRKVS